MKLEAKNNSRSFFLFIISATFLLALLFYGSFLPFVGYNSWNFNIYSLIAHNYNLFGVLDTHFAPIISVAEKLPDDPIYYFNHPPLLSLAISGVFRLFGESFFTARFVNIFSAFFSGILLYLIGYELKGKRFAVVVFLVYSLIPASVVFGRMIGQESVVLLFALVTFLAAFRYMGTKSRIWILLGCTTIVLGTLSDWATVYFSICIGLYLILNRNKSVGVLFCAISVVTAICYIAYVFNITNSVSVLTGGFLNRSAGGVTNMPFWIITWFSTLLLRVFLYFNPLFVMFSFFFLFRFKKLSEKKVYHATFSFFLFGVTHIVLYPEGSFGHPYWLYYLLPFITLSTAIVICSFNNRLRTLVLAIFLLSIVYIVGIVHWKTKEVEGNVFRYQLASIASSYFRPYQQIGVSRQGLIDPDIFQYSFMHPTQDFVSRYDPVMKDLDGFVFSCLSSCGVNNLQIKQMQELYAAEQVIGNDVEMWIFINDSKKSGVTKKKIALTVSKKSNSFFSKMYREVMTSLRLPQL